MKEMWKDVDGFEKHYKISSSGVIWSKRKNRPMKIQDNGHGYKCLMLFDENKKRHSFYVHRLVASHFVKTLKDIDM